MIEIGHNFFIDFYKGWWHISQYEIVSMPSPQPEFRYFCVFVWLCMIVNFILIKSVSKWKLLLNNCYKTVSGHFFAICTFIFHKTEVQTVSLRCLTVLNLNWLKSYGLRCSKKQIFKFPFFCDIVQKHKFVFFVFLGVASLLLYQLRFSLIKHLKMTVWISVLCRINM